MSKAKVQQKTLTEAEVFYVQEKSKEGMTADEIAVVLKCDVSLLTPHLKKAPKKPTRTLESYITKSAGGKGGVVVGTQRASERADSMPKPAGRDMSRFVTTTKGEE